MVSSACCSRGDSRHMQEVRSPTLYCICVMCLILYLFKSWDWGERDGSVIRSTQCSHGGPMFSFHHPHDGSLPSVTPMLGDLLWLLQVLDLHTTHIHICRQNAHTQKRKFFKLRWMSHNIGLNILSHTIHCYLILHNAGQPLCLSSSKMCVPPGRKSDTR